MIRDRLKQTVTVFHLKKSYLTKLFQDKILLGASYIKSLIQTSTNVICGKIKSYAKSLRGFVLNPITFVYILCISVYGIVRFWGLTKFPQYFFTDEAAAVNMAQVLIKNNWRDLSGQLFPIYINGAPGRWGPGLTIYLQAIGLLFFSKSVYLAKSVTVVTSIFGALSVGLILQMFFKKKHGWIGILVLSAIPSWYLHTRTAFDTVAGSSFLVVFVFFYLLYRVKNPIFGIIMPIFAALSFYSYSNFHFIVFATSILLLIFDLKYHVDHWKLNIITSIVGIMCLMPIINFQIMHKEAFKETMSTINSYTNNSKLSLKDKAEEFGSRYLYSISPFFWFGSNETTMSRHRVPDYPHINKLFLLPFLVGILICLIKFREAPYRTVLLVGLATTTGGAISEVGITRILAFTVFASIFITLGIMFLVDVFRLPLIKRSLYLSVGIILVIINFKLMNHSLTTIIPQSLYYRELQYGAEELFAKAIPTYLKLYPKDTLYVTPDWANATEQFYEFFLDSETKKRIVGWGINNHFIKRLPLNRSDTFVISYPEHKKLVDSLRFKDIEVVMTIQYPNGEPAFYFVKMTYADNFDSIITKLKEERSRPVTETISLLGKAATITHSQFDMGTIKNLFDGDIATIIRGLEANPLINDIVFSEPVVIRGVKVMGMHKTIIDMVEVFGEGDSSPSAMLEVKHLNEASEPESNFNLSNVAKPIKRLRISTSSNPPQPISANLHIREIILSQ